MPTKIGIGQDSHRFDDSSTKPLVLGGITIPSNLSLSGNSDVDVVLHAITNAVSGISTVNIIGAFSDRLCKEQGITDSAVYLREALKTLDGLRIVHLSVSIECLRPKLSPHIDAMRDHIAQLLSISPKDVGITATTGEQLTSFGEGKGIQVFAIVTAMQS